jgi:hypothetical protein
MTNEDLHAQLLPILTIQNARDYTAQTDQWLYVSYLIDGLNLKATDRRIEWVEHWFDLLIEEHGENEMDQLEYQERIAEEPRYRGF